MKAKGGKQEEMEKTKDQLIADLKRQAAVVQAKIITKDFEADVLQLAEDLKRFSEKQKNMDFIELINVYFVLADAYIEKKQTKRAERYLSTGYTVFFKIQEETKKKASTGILTPENQRNIDELRAELCKTIGKLKKAKGDYDDAIKQLSHSIYLDSCEYGPENFRLTSRYYLLGETFRSQGKIVEARKVLEKVVTIWKDCLIKKLCGSLNEDPAPLLMEEAYDNLKTSLVILESELGTMSPAVGECIEAIGLIEMTRGKHQVAAEYLQKAYDILNNSAGQFDKRTEEVQNISKLNAQAMEHAASKPRAGK